MKRLSVSTLVWVFCAYSAHADLASRFFLRLHPETTKAKEAEVSAKLAKAKDGSAAFLKLLKQLPSSVPSGSDKNFLTIQYYRGPHFFYDYPHQLDHALQKGYVLKSPSVLKQVAETLPKTFDARAGYLLSLATDFDDPLATEILRNALNSKAPEVRQAALLEMSLSRNPAQFEKELRAGLTDPLRIIQRPALMGMVLIHSPQSIDTVVKTLACKGNHDDSRQIEETIFYLGALPPKEIAPIVIRHFAKICEDKMLGYKLLRNGFLFSLLQQPRGAEVVADLTGDSDKQTKEFTQGLLKSMWADGPDSPVAWKEYFEKKMKRRY